MAEHRHVRRAAGADAAARTMTLRVYDGLRREASVGIRASRANHQAGGRSAATVGLPEGCAVGKARRQLITETVTLSPSQSVGPSKRGPRNIIPITGGELTGRITGKVLRGGADYQNLPARDDRRAVSVADRRRRDHHRAERRRVRLARADVRSARDSPYAWLNTGTCLSSNPEMRPGGVGRPFSKARAERERHAGSPA